MYILFLCVLLFFLFLQKVPEGFQIWKETRGTNYSGNDLSHGIYTVMECKKKCIENRDCKGITTTSLDGGEGSCWIKSELSQGTPANNLNSYLLSRV